MGVPIVAPVRLVLCGSSCPHRRTILSFETVDFFGLSEAEASRRPSHQTDTKSRPCGKATSPKGVLEAQVHREAGNSSWKGRGASRIQSVLDLLEIGFLLDVERAALLRCTYILLLYFPGRNDARHTSAPGCMVYSLPVVVVVKYYQAMAR